MAAILIDGKKHMLGEGPPTAKIMFVLQNPTNRESDDNRPFSDRMVKLLDRQLEEAGILRASCYITYAVKYSTYENRTPSATDVKTCREALLSEIATVKPEVIVPMGTTAFQAVMGGGYKITDFVGVMLPLKGRTDVQVYPLWSPAFLLRNNQMIPQFQTYMKALAGHLEGQKVTGRSELAFRTVRTKKDCLETLVEIAKDADRFIVLDVETKGANWMVANRYIRTVQVNWGYGKTAVFVLYPTMVREVVDDVPVVSLPLKPEGAWYPECLEPQTFFDAFNDYLAAARPKVVGHNIRYDGEWLLSFGVDIRPYTYYDTMLAEHLINNTLGMGLDDLTLRYSNFGKYDGELERWKKANSDSVSPELGYGAVPESILLPYGATDVEVPRHAHDKQQAMLAPYIKKVYLDQVSLTDMVMDCEHSLYEMELAGLDVDVERVQKLVEVYHKKRVELEAKFLTMVMNRGYTHEFNHRSVEHVRKLLFDQPSAEGKGGLGLVPITTTKPKGGQKKKWDWVMAQPPEVRKHYKPSTDKQTLEILEDQDPLVYHLLNIRRVDVICKNFFREDDEGGIKGNLWPDDKLHPRFSQLTDTGRLRTGKPNTQNFQKASERFLKEVFGKDAMPFPMRSICVVGDGEVMIEADIKQAELFVMSGLADDKVMLDILSTPGKDLHTITTMDAFRIKRTTPEGKPVDEAWVVDFASKDPKGFEELEKGFIYIDPKGNRMTHSQFKNGLRVAGKSIGFGIAYGRGAQAIAQQVMAETGVNIPAAEIKEAIDAWKTKYSKTWEFLSNCQSCAVDPGYVENAFGRRRYFAKTDDEAVIAANKRESGNMPIQSTVADFMRLVMLELSAA